MILLSISAAEVAAEVPVPTSILQGTMQRHEEDETFSRLSQNKLGLTPSLRHTLSARSPPHVYDLRLYVELDLVKRFSLNAILALLKACRSCRPSLDLDVFLYGSLEFNVFEATPKIFSFISRNLSIIPRVQRSWLSYGGRADKISSQANR